MQTAFYMDGFQVAYLFCEYKANLSLFFDIILIFRMIRILKVHREENKEENETSINPRHVNSIKAKPRQSQGKTFRRLFTRQTVEADLKMLTFS